MLTKKQKNLFKLLEIPEDQEKDIRRYHKLVKETGRFKDFTYWLHVCLKAKWQREHERSRPLYVGD
jgi:hypothetical protein